MLAPFEVWASLLYGYRCLAIPRCNNRVVSHLSFCPLSQKDNKMEIDAKKKLQFLDLYSMVMADGIVHPKEMETLYRIGIEDYGLTEEEITNSVKSSGFSMVIPELPEERIAVLYEMAEIAWADGKLEESERNMLRRYAALYEVKEDSIDELVDILLDKAKNGIEKKQVLDELNA